MKAIIISAILCAVMMPCALSSGVEHGDEEVIKCIHHNYTIGKFQTGQKLYHTFYYNESGSYINENTVTVRFPEKDEFSKAITQVRLVNLNEQCNCYGEDVEIVDGGIGKKFIKLNVTTWVNCPNTYAYLIYQK